MKKQLLAATLGVALLCGTSLLHAAEPQDPKPFTKAELDQFIADYPGLVQWLGTRNPQADVTRNPWIVSSMRADRDFNARLKEKNWNPDRFFYLFHHINTGLVMAESEKSQAELRARMAKEQKENEARLAKEQKENEARLAEGRQQLDKEMQAANARMRAQLKAQQEQIRNNPYIPPYEKQRILTQMESGYKNNNPVAAAVPTDANSAAEASRKQQANWIAAQEQQIKNNPYMHPMQRQQALEQLKQAKKNLEQSAASAANRAKGAASPDPANQQADLEKMHAQWFTNQKQVINNNPAMPPEQKRIALEQLKRSEKQFQESMTQQANPPSILPKEEKALIDANQQKLAELLTVKKP
ncbi:MAG: hypothetical protein H7834_02435 [Magnetococcus sp. YQC-9]